jgi:hypothetical protein
MQQQLISTKDIQTENESIYKRKNEFLRKMREKQDSLKVQRIPSAFIWDSVYLGHLSAKNLLEKHAWTFQNVFHTQLFHKKQDFDHF